MIAIATHVAAAAVTVASIVVILMMLVMWVVVVLLLLLLLLNRLVAREHLKAIKDAFLAELAVFVALAKACHLQHRRPYVVV